MPGRPIRLRWWLVQDDLLHAFPDLPLARCIMGVVINHGALHAARRGGSILITGINILAGFPIGVLQHGGELRRALETHIVLGIGDGLATVIPALMISI